MSRRKQADSANFKTLVERIEKNSHGKKSQRKEIKPTRSISVFWWYSSVAALAILCYISSLWGDFVFDDTEAVVNNADVRSDVPVTNCFFNDFWGTRLTRNASHKSYRPLTIISFRFNYWLSDGLHPRGFHVLNLLLHGVISMLVYHLLRPLLPAPWGWIASLIFSCHPVHTEAIAAVVGRADLMCAFFYLLGIFSYMHAILKPPELSTSNRMVYISVSIVLTVLAMLCKEQGITAIGMFVVVDALRITTSQKSNTMLWSLLVRVSIVSLSAAVMFWTRWNLMGGPPVFQKVDNPAAFHSNLIVRIINYHYVYALNAWLLLCPLWLCFDWSMGCVPLITDLCDPRLLAVLAFWAAILALLYTAYRTSNNQDRRCIIISLAFMVVPFFPAANLLVTVGFVVAERVLYLPSIGFCLLLAHGANLICRSGGKHLKKVVYVCAFVVIAALTCRSVTRSWQWLEEETLFASGLQVCPLNAKVHYNIAKNAADNGLVDKALTHYEEALRLNPEYDQAMNNLANLVKDLGEVERAERLLLNATKIRSEFAAAWMNLGIVQATLRKYREAERSYHTAIQHRNKYPDCYYNLGNLYLEQKRYEEAYDAWRNATALRPTHTVAWTNMLIMLDNIGNLAQAEQVGMEALAVLPSEPGIHFNLANTLGKAGRFLASEKHFLIAIDLNPSYPSYHANLGVLYHRWKKYSAAEDAYRKALSLDPQLRSARENLDMLLKKVSRVK